jgi:hypothetical protein
MVVDMAVLRAFSSSNFLLFLVEKVTKIYIRFQIPIRSPTLKKDV